ncbi:MAG TPA: hypothetical protein VFD58_27630 [Blastocatellia bacterium]|nr:hypothetical protein [Blastocatellia bacterium]
MQKRNLSILISPGFLICLCLLLLNDFVLKQAFHNWLTGKLSDFAGLFVFPLFFTAFFPRFKTSIYIITGLAFIFWKLPSSQPLIEVWNRQEVHPVGRTPDSTDLLALISLPLSFIYEDHCIRFKTGLVKAALVSVISIVAFSATSYRLPHYRIEYFKDYNFEVSQGELMKRIDRLKKVNFYEKRLQERLLDHEPAYQSQLRASRPLQFEVGLSQQDYYGRAGILVISDGGGSRITLVGMDLYGQNKPGKGEVLKYFEEEFVEPLRKEHVIESWKIKSINFVPSVPN